MMRGAAHFAPVVAGQGAREIHALLLFCPTTIGLEAEPYGRILGGRCFVPARYPCTYPVLILRSPEPYIMCPFQGGAHRPELHVVLRSHVVIRDSTQTDAEVRN